MPFLATRTRLVAVAAGVLLAVGAPAAYATLGGEAPASAASSAAARGKEAAARGKEYVETRLFFGTQRPDGGPDVTAEQFMRFVERHVTSSFPSGLTVQNGWGQWRDANGTIERERSYELILLYPGSEADVRDDQIERIRDAYERAYAQESVARLDEPTWADF